ncbi:diacylglycerol kinase family protein [Microbispora sp. NPDC049125]|uniref:diacylglycerol/lipid kinase family protein n=1 Tax=Microbispora sp. NPDC049125 TaxID=3154929 RepID=UPI0034664891
MGAVLIVANPAAGTTDDRLLAQVTELCAEHAATVRVHRTACAGDATTTVRAAVREPDCPDLVVAVGGDGTVREVIEGLAGEGRSALAIVPAGTGNSGYRMLWGERPWASTLRSALTGDGARLREFDLAEVAETGALVFLGACSGVVAQALVGARETGLTGRARYAKTLADSAAAFVPYPGRVTVDGVELHRGDTVLANVGGGRYRGGQYLLLPHSEFDDGLLDVCVVASPVRPAEVPTLVREGEHLGREGVFYGRGRVITVERLDGGPLLFEHDGELQPATRSAITLRVMPGALPVWTG